MTRKHKKSLLEQASDYHRFGWSIIPIRAETKRPAIRSWKQYQAKRSDESQLQKWFGNGRYESLAVVCGAVSGDLAVLDLDSEARCQWWRKEHPELAKSLPTAETKKGLHVYFRSEPFRKQNGDEVDLLCEGACAILPPSPEKQWLTPLDGELPLHDPFQWGLEQFGIKRPQPNRNLTEHAEHTEHTEHTETIRVSVLVEDYTALTDRTLPKKYRQRNSKIFYLALGLKSIEGHWNADPKCFRAVVKQWHKRARPHIRTKDFLVTWLDFLVAWRNIMYKKIDPKKIFELCKELTPPEQIVKDHPGYPELWQLCLLCRELDEAHGIFGTTAYLSCRTIGEVLDINHDTANTYFKILTFEGYLRIIAKGKMTAGGGIATRFRYIAG